MRAVVQRVARAEVRVEGTVVGAIGPGLAILLGVGRSDGTAEADRLAGRLARLRVFRTTRAVSTGACSTRAAPRSS